MKVHHRFFRSLIPAVALLAVGASLGSLTGNTSQFSAAAQAVTTVNAASYSTDNTVAPNSIAAGFGTFKTQNNQVYVATSLPLPKLLGGVKVTVNSVDAELFFTATGQINYVIPPNTPTGATPVSVTVTNNDGTTVPGTVKVANTAPGIFSAKSSGLGAAAAQTTFDGITYQSVADAAGNENTLNAGTVAKPNFLILYGTGIRNATAANVKATIQGVPSRVDFVGAAPGFTGLDQLNVRIPPELSGFGSLNVKLSVTSVTPNPTSNTVTMKLGGEIPGITTTRITAQQFGQTINGTLTIDDQIELNPTTRDTYFFDAYRITATPNLGVAIDLRSTQFDALLIVYRIGTDGSITEVASDDLSGGFSDGNKLNNNATLVTVFPDSSDYLIFATTADGNPDGVGAYSIKLTANVVQPITYGTTISNGSITTSDIQISTGDYWKAYSFQATKGDKIQIDLKSTAFNSYLVLNDNSGKFIDQDDNSGGNQPGSLSLQDARLNLKGLPTQTPPLPAEIPTTGTYIIIATPYKPGVTGNFVFALAKTNDPAEGAALIAGSPEEAIPQLPSRNTEAINKERRSTSEHYVRRRVIRRD